MLAVVQDVLGSLDLVKRVVKVQGFVNASASYQEHHKVLNGFSDLMMDVFEEKGVHARSVLELFLYGITSPYCGFDIPGRGVGRYV